MTEQLFTADGWVEFDEGGDFATDFRCCCCEAVAAVIVNQGTVRKPVLWAVCQPCSTEIAGENYDAQRRSEYEMDYYSGNE